MPDSAYQPRLKRVNLTCVLCHWIVLLPATVALTLTLAVACEPAKPPATPTAALPAPAAPAIPYGANKAAGATFGHDDVTLYYETYGQGQPLLLVHGNSASIASLAAQIECFKVHYKVIAMDSRDQGRSSDSEGPITCEKMTDDLAALLDHLQTVFRTRWRHSSR